MADEWPSRNSLATCSPTYADARALERDFGFTPKKTGAAQWPLSFLSGFEY